MAESPGFPIVSNFLKFSNHARVSMARFAGIHRSDRKVIVIGIDGELVLTVAFESEDEAVRELIAISDQIDCWETATVTRDVAAEKRHGRR
jgi:hypothetical protein